MIQLALLLWIIIPTFQNQEALQFSHEHPPYSVKFSEPQKYQGFCAPSLHLQIHTVPQNTGDQGYFDVTHNASCVAI